jgi:hypothetical protein
MDAPILMELDNRNLFPFIDQFVFIGFANRKNGIADHLRTQRRSCSDFRVAQIMQRNSIPAALFYNKGDNLIASSRKSLSQLKELLRLLLTELKLNVDGPLHKGKIIFTYLFEHKLKWRAALLPALKDRVSALSF